MEYKNLFEIAKMYRIQQIESEFMEVIKRIPEGSVGLEIGCYSGGTTIVFANLCDKLCTVDMSKIFNTGEVEMLCKHNFIIGNSTSPATVEAVKNFFGDQKLDFLFIDGDHTEEGAYRDYVLYSPLVKSGGMIFFHDIVDTPSHQKQNCFVSRAWNRVKAGNKYEEFVAGQEWGGIGMLIKE